MALICKTILRGILRSSSEILSTRRNFAQQMSSFSVFGMVRNDSCLFMPLRTITVDVTKAKSVESNQTTFQKDKKVQRKKPRQYTVEEDNLILKRVKQMGYNNPETWKTLSKDLDRDYPSDIKRRCDLIVSRDSKEKTRQYTEKEDNIIIARVNEMGYDNPETWKTLSKELNRYHVSGIKARYDLITSRDSKEMKRYSDEDDKYIIRYIKKNGDNPNSWNELGILFGVLKQSVKTRHDLLTNKKNTKLGPYTKEEDEVILKMVELHGNNTETFKDLATKLNRQYYTGIKDRHEFLMKPPLKPKSNWTIDEDKILLETVFKVNKKILYFPLAMQRIIITIVIITLIYICRM